MKSKKIIFSLFVAVLFTAQMGISQEKKTEAPFKKTLDSLMKVSDSKSSNVVNNSASLPVSQSFSNDLKNQIDSTSKRSMLEIEANYHNYMFTQRIKIYDWQLNSAKILFFIVVIIVIVGLFLSYLQFKISTEHIKHKIKSQSNVSIGTDSVDANTDTKFEISKDGIKIDSAVIGLIILVISIVFFFLYLKYVFPIQLPGN